jgi:hypothetical protein
MVVPPGAAIATAVPHRAKMDARATTLRREVPARSRRLM